MPSSSFIDVILLPWEVLYILPSLQKSHPLTESPNAIPVALRFVVLTICSVHVFPKSSLKKKLIIIC
jgi:hypothetical protein